MKSKYYIFFLIFFIVGTLLGAWIIDNDWSKAIYERDCGFSVTNCWDGCIFAERTINNNLTKPTELYNECSDYCWKEFKDK